MYPDYCLKNKPLLSSSQSLMGPQTSDGPFISPCIEEDELEHETSSQPSMSMWTH